MSGDGVRTDPLFRVDACGIHYGDEPGMDLHSGKV